MRDLFSSESLAVRKARSSKKRGSLEWILVNNHEASSYVDYLIRWSDYLHRIRLCGSKGVIDTHGLDQETESLINTYTIDQPALMKLRYYERSMGIRFSRCSICEAVASEKLSKAVKLCYSYGLVYMLLEREAIVQSWI